MHRSTNWNVSCYVIKDPGEGNLAMLENYCQELLIISNSYFIPRTVVGLRPF